MSKSLDMKVNVLPVYTYNFLHVNDSNLSLDNINNISVETPDAVALPEDVQLEKGLSFEKAGEVFIANKAKIAPETEGYVMPNGDTSERDNDQALRTGMGVDVDKLMTEMGVKTDLFTVEENVKVNEPVVLRYAMKDGDAVLSAQVIHAKKNSEVTVIMDYDSEKDAKGLLGVSTRILAEEGAKVTLVKTQLLGKGFVHFDDLGTAALEGASIRVIGLELGGAKVWAGSYASLPGKESEFLSDIGYLCREDHNLDINYVSDHRGKKTNAVMNFKGVLLDEASKTLRFTIDFKNGSAGSAGDEQEDTLLLSEDVVNRTMPIILCQEEDVDGRHGATIGQLSEDLLFYMQSRGIDEEEAKRIMIRARLESVANMIPEAELKQRVVYYIQNIL